MNNVLYELKKTGEVIIGKPVKVDKGMVTVDLAGFGNSKRTLWIDDIVPAVPVPQ